MKSRISSLLRLDLFCVRTLELGLAADEAKGAGRGKDGGLGGSFTPADLADLASSLAAFMYRPDDDWVQVS